MKAIILRVMLFSCAALFIKCGQSDTCQVAPAFEEKVFVVNTVDNDEKLKEYLAYHEQVWPEVEAGFRKAGYKRIALYRFNDLVVMTILVPVGADLDEMGRVAESYSPRCAEWNTLMNTYQKGVKGTTEGQKWVESIPFYEFNN
ncbi:L-rhamnose mutarotase [Sphingobacterium lumbrici]|uniref:L-rhamnose mutarotase n=1 Tax=Sphingobacterium lumbrici TaxID=2559600 RepID=UPI0011268CDE|nr:L-rhamnose mutarotase [Sphingobacterium lumbrici]